MDAVEKIVEQIKEFSQEDKLRVLEQVQHMLKANKPLVHHLTDLKGMGSGVWKGVDAGNYVDSERG